MIEARVDELVPALEDSTLALSSITIEDSAQSTLSRAEHDALGPVAECLSVATEVAHSPGWSVTAERGLVARE